MKPKNRTVLHNLESWSLDSLIDLRLMARRLELKGDEIPGEFDKARAAVAACLKPIEDLQNEVNALYESDALASLCARAVPLSEGEIGQLLTLNRHLKDVASHLLSVAGDVTPRLKAKVADPDDPMYDYEIEARIDYQLREDDPDYDEEDDNYLSTRTESLRRLSTLEEEDFTEPGLPAALRAEPHCWLFHDLYDHGYGPESPQLSFQDCLRIGRIYVDVQVWQQYIFDAQGEPPCEIKRRWLSDRGGEVNPPAPLAMNASEAGDSGWDLPVAGAVDIGGVGSFTLINSSCALPDSRNTTAERKAEAEGGRRVLMSGDAARPSGPDAGKLLADSTDRDIADAIAGLDVALVFAGAEISPVIARTLREKRIRSLGLATLPADPDDGQVHPQVAAAGTPEPGQHGRSALPISNGALERAIADNATMGHILNNKPGAFVWLCRGGILIEDILGFKADDVWTMVNPQGYTALGWGSASGTNRAATAARKALSLPLLGVRRLQEASRVLISIAASRQTLRLSECTFIMSYFRNDLAPGAFYIFGATRELDGSDEFRVSILATGRIQ